MVQISRLHGCILNPNDKQLNAIIRRIEEIGGYCHVFQNVMRIQFALVKIIARRGIAIADSTFIQINRNSNV